MEVSAILLFALAAVAVRVVVEAVSERTGLPAAALLVVVGLAYAVLPGPNLVLEPEVVLYALLPPLLYSAALQSSLGALKSNLRGVVSLSVVLVLVTAVLVGVGVDLLVPGATLAVGVALGAAVSPPDPVAALAVAQRVGLPPRMVTLIQGEGLLNDATALTTLSVAISVATGSDFSALGAVGQFALAAAGGVAVGAGLALLLRVLRPLARSPLSATTISLSAPFAAYLLGEAAHASGVLAVVVTGLVVGRTYPVVNTGASRLQNRAVWQLVEFLLEGLVFLIIGMQLPVVVSGLSRYPVGVVVAATAVSVAVVLLVRPLWLAGTQALPRGLHTRLGGRGGDPGERNSRLTAREVAVLSWAGSRGVVTLAAISTLPLTTASGADFPARDLLLFISFVVVLVTLVGQGSTFAPLVRRLGLRADEAELSRLRNQARAGAVDAGLGALDDIVEQQQLPAEAADRARAHLEETRDLLQRRLQVFDDADPGRLPPSEGSDKARLARAVIDVQRDELVRWRDDGRLPDSALRQLQRELDVQEGLLAQREENR